MIRRFFRTPKGRLIIMLAALTDLAMIDSSQVLLAANTPMLLKASMVEGRTDLGVMASGQVAGVIDDLPSCAELVSRVMAEAHQVLEALAAQHSLRTLPPAG